MADPQLEMLLNALEKQTSDEYFYYNLSENLQEHLRPHGVRANVSILKQDIENGSSRLLRIASSDGDGQLVRCVRVLRVIVKGRTVDGMRVLIENDPSNQGSTENPFPTSKINLDCDLEVAWLGILKEKLGLPNNWISQFLSLESCKEATLKVSYECPGLPTWCIVEEANVRVNDTADKSELMLLGLPAGGIFRGAGRKCQRIWLWADVDSSIESTQSIGPACIPSKSPREASKKTKSPRELQKKDTSTSLTVQQSSSLTSSAAQAQKKAADCAAQPRALSTSQSPPAALRARRPSPSQSGSGSSSTENSALPEDVAKSDPRSTGSPTGTQHTQQQPNLRSKPKPSPAVQSVPATGQQLGRASKTRSPPRRGMSRETAVSTGSRTRGRSGASKAEEDEEEERVTAASKYHSTM
jgi:hypothetical protein